MSPTCVTCGGRLPLDSWSTNVCTDDCLDAFVDRTLLARTPLGAVGLAAATA